MSVKLVTRGIPDLVIEEFAAAPAIGAPGLQFRAYLRGRSAGGQLTGHGSTAIRAVTDLQRRVEGIAEAIRLGREHYEALPASERRSVR